MHAQRPDEEARRAYWVQQMEAAYAFQAKASAYPVAECGEPMGFLPDAARQAGVEVLFSTTAVSANYHRLFYLRQGLIKDFTAVARDMNDRGWILKVEDAYRTRDIQKHLARKEGVFDQILRQARWELGGEMPSAEFMLRRITALIATKPKIGTHMSGTALDISAIERESGKALDRGGPYLEMSELTPMSSPFVAPAARRNREAITEVLARHGFVHYQFEFWHYSKGDAYDGLASRTSRPARYGAVDLDLATGRVAPVSDPHLPLNSTDEIQAEIERALKRAGTT